MCGMPHNGDIIGGLLTSSEHILFTLQQAFKCAWWLLPAVYCLAATVFVAQQCDYRGVVEVRPKASSEALIRALE